jgi:hypothetical protein
MIPKRWKWICRTRAIICIICMDLGGNLWVVLALQTGLLDRGWHWVGQSCIYDETQRRSESGVNDGPQVQ